jgi:hypothetical protein
MTFKDLVLTIRNYRENEIALGRLLLEAKSSYRDLVGEGINTWHDFIAQPEIALSTTEANFLLGIAETFFVIDYMGMPKANAKLILKMGEVDEEILYAAKTLSIKDFRDRYYDLVTEEKGERTYSYLVMKKCNETGNLSKVHEVESEEVLSAFKDKIHD